MDTDVEPDAHSWAISPVTGEFVDGVSERRFRAENAQEWARSVRNSIGGLGLAFLALGFVDYLHLGSSAAFVFLTGCRVAVFIICLSAVVVTYRIQRAIVTDLAVSLAQTALLIAACVIVAVKQEEVAIYAVVIITIIYFFYVFVPNSFMATVWVSVAGSISFVLTNVLYVPHTDREIFTVVVLLGLVNVVGVFTVQRLYALQRRAFASVRHADRTNDSLREEIALREKLRDSSDRNAMNMRQLFEAAPFPMSISRINTGQIVRVNEAARALFRVAEHDVTNLYMPDFFDSPNDLHDMVGRIKEGGRVTNFPLLGRSFEGRIFQVRVSARRVVFNGSECVMTAFTETAGVVSQKGL